MGDYGLEVILDLHDCNVAKFNRTDIEEFFRILCDEKLHMERSDLHWWDYEGDPEGYAEAPEHLKGISAIQFITTSNITLHTLDDLRRVYLNIFSCKQFDPTVVVEFSELWFEGKSLHTQIARRI